MSHPSGECNTCSARSDIGIDDCRELRDVLGPVVADALPALIPSPKGPPKPHPADGPSAGQPSEDGQQWCTVSGVPVELVRPAAAHECAHFCDRDPSLSPMTLALDPVSLQSCKA